MSENKGKPSGKFAATKTDLGRKGSSRTKREQGGAGPEQAVHSAGRSRGEQRAGGPEHHGAEAFEDRNP